MFLAGRLASYKVPVAIRFVDALPRNVNRKIDRKLLITRAPEDFAAVIATETEY
jgi:acyl-CoA synthetase (AMP-forming)/AMP-acid ligase II